MCKRSTSIIVAGLTLGGLLFIGSPAGAQSVYNLDQREDRQQQRIQQGVDSGALTPKPGAWKGNRPASRPPKTG